MIKRIFLFMLLCVSLAAYAQEDLAQKPKVMVMPDPTWCVKRGYGSIVDGKDFPDYRAALRDENLRDAIVTIENLFQKRGFPLDNLQSKMGKLDDKAARGQVLTGKQVNGGGGAAVKESDADVLLRSVHPDIVIYVEVTNNKVGPRNQIKGRVMVNEATSGQNIYSNVVESAASGGSVMTLVQDCMLKFIDEMTIRMQESFNDTRANGRQGSVTFAIAEDCPYNLDSEIETPKRTIEFVDVLGRWLRKHAVGKKATQADKGDNTVTYDVRMPLTIKDYNDDDELEDVPCFADNFYKGLIDYLKPYGVSVKIYPIGIGEAHIILGGR